MDSINLVESFSEFKEFKNIDRERLMRIIEDVFRSVIIKKIRFRRKFRYHCQRGQGRP